MGYGWDVKAIEGVCMVIPSAHPNCSRLIVFQQMGDRIVDPLVYSKGGRK